MELLSQFLLRLAFGLAVGMGITSPRLVSSGFFRNHLYVTLGLATLAALALAQSSPLALWLAIATAVLSYIGSVCWLYEAPRAGRVALWLVAACALAGGARGETAAGRGELAGDAAADFSGALGAGARCHAGGNVIGPLVPQCAGHGTGPTATAIDCGGVRRSAAGFAQRSRSSRRRLPTAVRRAWAGGCLSCCAGRLASWACSCCCG